MFHYFRFRTKKINDFSASLINIIAWAIATLSPVELLGMFKQILQVRVSSGEFGGQVSTFNSVMFLKPCLSNVYSVARHLTGPSVFKWVAHAILAHKCPHPGCPNKPQSITFLPVHARVISSSSKHLKKEDVIHQTKGSLSHYPVWMLMCLSVDALTGDSLDTLTSLILLTHFSHNQH